MFRNIKRSVIAVIFFAGLGLLAACDTAEERAEAHFQKSLEHLESGDIDRALVELRNVFQLNGEHREARLTYARTVLERGNQAEAFSQYLRLVEQYPNDLEGRRHLAHMSAQSNNWDAAERHLKVAEPQAPEDLVIRSVRAGVDYQNALRDDDGLAQQKAAQVARDLLQEDLDLPVAQAVAVSNLLRAQEWTQALTLLDQLLTVSDAFNLHRLRVTVLSQLGENDEAVEHLRYMVDRFPEAGLHRTLITRLMDEERFEAAEAYLRERAADTALADGDDGAQPRLELLSFLAQRKGADAAIAEVDAMLAASDGYELTLKALRANLDFDRGNRDAALAAFETLANDDVVSRELDRVKVLYARLLQQTGDVVGARAQVEEVLEHDSGQTGAIKMKARWLIQDDQPGDALVELRVALDNAPRDAEILTLMAQAHQRTGDQALMAEMLAMSAEVSGYRRAETLRYASYLVQEDNLFAAEEILLSGLRRHSEDVQVLSRLGDLYIRIEDWGRARQVIGRIEGLQDGQSASAVAELTARLLAAQNRSQDLADFLLKLTEGQGQNIGAAAAIIRLHLANGEVEKALEYSTSLLEADPDNPTLRFLQAGVMATDGRLNPAAQVLEALVVDYPQAEATHLALYRVYRSMGDVARAGATLGAAVQALPQSSNLKWIQAGHAEAQGDIDGAIAIYETLYEADSSNAIIANNLASLLATYRTDEESLQRAFIVARRLRNTDQPAFQDTYGWIATRLGNHDEALDYLEDAAAGLPSDPVVQFHLAEVYRLLRRDLDALPYYEKAVALSAPLAVKPPFMAQVAAEIERIKALQ